MTTPNLDDGSVSVCDGLAISSEGMFNLPPRLRLSLLNFLIRWERYEDALPVAEHLASEQSDGLLYRSMLVKILAALGRFDEAEAIVRELDEQHPHRLNALAAAGDLEMARGDLPAALKRYLQMIEISPETPKAFRRLAALYFAAGQIEKSHAYCRMALEHYEKTPDGKKDESGPHPGLLRVLARIHRARGDDSLAAEIEKQLYTREMLEEASFREGIVSSETTVKPIPAPKLRTPATVPAATQTRPANPPPPPIPPEAAECLASVFGHHGFRIGQEEAAARALACQDLLITMPTGAGKSLCYQLPAALGRKVLVISPLIALMKDQIDGLPEALASDATLVNSTLESDELDRRQADIAAGRYNLIYAAPERLRQPPFLHALRKAKIDIVVVDEVHCVSVWGHDFRPDYFFIAPALDLLGNPTFCGMTATADPTMKAEIEEQIGRRLTFVSTGTHRPNLTLEVRHVSKGLDKLRELARICRSVTGSGIIYVNSRKKTEEIASFLRTSGVEAGYYHAGMQPEARVAAQEAFMTGRCRVMAATVAFGMGIDKRDVRFVAHYSLPRSIENYYQEAGRAGRDGLPSRCILLYSPSDKARLTKWIESEQIRMDDLKSVYHYIKRLIPSGSGPVHEDDILRDSVLDDTKTRVAVSLLERAGLIERRSDIPVSVTIRVRASLDAAEEGFAKFVAAARLREGQRIALEFADLSERTGIPLHELESRLFEWRDRGLISFRTSGRTMYINLCRVGAGARETLNGMIETHRSASVRKMERLIDYVRYSGCRHDFISRHFGDPPIRGCRSCDNCLKGTTPFKLNGDHIRILKGMLSLPIRLGKTGLVRALTGSSRCPIRPHEWPHLGAFSGMTQSSAEALIGDLIDWGYLERDGTMLRPLLSLTAAGRKLAVNGGRTQGEPSGQSLRSTVNPS